MLSRAVYKPLEVRNFATSSSHLNDNGVVEPVSHAMAQRLVMVIFERLNDGDTPVLHVTLIFRAQQSGHRNTGLAPNEAHIWVSFQVPPFQF